MSDYPELYGELSATEDNEHWYVIYTKPRREKKLAEYCFNNQITYFLPLLESVKIYQRKKVVYTKPMFTSYVFVKATFQQKQTILISGHTVCFLTVKDEKIFLAELRAIYKVRSGDLEVTEHKYLEEGYRVRFIRGSLAGTEGIVKDADNIKHVVLQVEMLRQAIAVTANADDLEIIDDD